MGQEGLWAVALKSNAGLHQSKCPTQREMAQDKVSEGLTHTDPSFFSFYLKLIPGPP